MSKNLLALCLVSLTLLNTPNVSADGQPWGLCPACPSPLCGGSIPCDNFCGGPALIQMGTTFSTNTGELITAYTDLTSALNDVTSSMNDLGVDVTESLTDQNNRLLSALSASTQKIELTSVAADESLLKNQVHIAKTLKTALAQAEIARDTEDNKRFIGPISQPLSGQMGVNAAKSLKKISVQSSQVRQEALLGFNEFLDDERNTAGSAGTGIYSALSLAELNQFDRLDHLLKVTTYDKEKFEQMQKLLGHVASQIPLKKYTSGNSSDYELKRKQHNLMLTVAFDALLTPAISRMGTDEAIWVDYYQRLERNSDGLSGETSYLESEVTGRLDNIGWWGSVKFMNRASIQRESLNQKAVAAYLNNKFLEMDNKSNQLLSILLTNRLQAKSEDLKKDYQSL